MPDERLPIHEVRAAFDASVEQARRGGRGARIVLSAPTGTGKSTEVPRWFPGSVLVVEPRRVACRSLAARVASLQGVELGAEIGYAVRDDVRRGPRTRLLFATPGMVLNDFGAYESFESVVLDEFHERRLDVDLLLALYREETKADLLVMSATLQAERLAQALGATLLEATSRAFPVRVEYLPGREPLPERGGLEVRVREALKRAESLAGDILVFLPGKAEIAAIGAECRDLGYQLVELHGGLSLEHQARVFEPSERRKLILATNVAETSLTIPGVGVVIDSGLVRRTRYHAGRGFLSLAPIASDSAEQRAGRAGRTGPGVAFRLWSPAAVLEALTPPEIRRESLVPLVLTSAALGRRVEDLQFVDTPAEHALDSARAELEQLGALDATGQVTRVGCELAGLPLDPALGRLIVEARGRDAFDDVVDLVAALATGRRLVREVTDFSSELEAGDYSDACVLIRAVRKGRAKRHGLDPQALAEARQNARRLRRAFGRAELPPPEHADDPSGEAVGRIALQADHRAGYVARRRKRSISWSSGGTEVELGRESVVSRLLAGPDHLHPEALVVFETRALGVPGVGGRANRIIATCAQRASLRDLFVAGLGREQVTKPSLDERGHVRAVVQRVHAGKCLGESETTPSGEQLVDALCALVLRGTVFRGVAERSELRSRQWALVAQLSKLPAGPLEGFSVDPPPPYVDWLRERIATLGVSQPADWQLLDATDLELPVLPPEIAPLLEREFPLSLHLGDARYRVNYDLSRKQVILEATSGHPKKPPPANYLPRFHGLRVFVEAGGTLHRVR
ncbi:MAG: ATP-dependent RNA helicase [Polyangiaceae bacterium]|nr:ATP-dependent RNA helicase [Myxococcales bacterium]MCB9587461.1 ATP-dependent RNA helicase [Polyangiaceae bacterium]MCB9605742.1 ATP-dependent RNA helicase [Polyangiaceae bacterium]